jgi:hypothetical protein
LTFRPRKARRGRHHGLDLEWNSSAAVVSGTLSATNSNDPAAANGMAYNTTWDSIGMPSILAITGQALELADNYVDVKKGSKWLPPTGSYAQTFEGTFNSQPNTGASTPGDYLLGSANANAITIQSTANNSALTSFGFRIASQDLTSFDVVINLLDVNGNVIQTLNASNYSALGNLSGGGNQCTSLAASPPVPCNTAPFIAVMPSQSNVFGFTVVTTNTSGGADAMGFYMDTLYYNQLPEPASLLLTGIGFASLLALHRRRKRRQA